MNWSYVAGLFDGEGSVGFVKSESIHPFFSISTTSPTLIEKLTQFFKENGISSSSHISKVALGKTGLIAVQSWDGTEKVVKALMPFVYEKHLQLLIFKQGIDLHKTCVLTHGFHHLLAHKDDWNQLRSDLHSLAHKGRKTIKVY